MDKLSIVLVVIMMMFGCLTYTMTTSVLASALVAIAILYIEYKLAGVVDAD